MHAAFDRGVIKPHAGHILCAAYPAICGRKCILLYTNRAMNTIASRLTPIPIAFISPTLDRILIYSARRLRPAASVSLAALDVFIRLIASLGRGGGLLRVRLVRNLGLRWLLVVRFVRSLRSSLRQWRSLGALRIRRRSWIRHRRFGGVCCLARCVQSHNGSDNAQWHLASMTPAKGAQMSALPEIEDSVSNR
jgi:hypothetical protein